MDINTATELASTYDNCVVLRITAANRLAVMGASLGEMEDRLSHARVMGIVWSALHGDESRASIQYLERQVAAKQDSVNQAQEALARASEASHNAYGELQQALRVIRANNAANTQG